MDLKVHDIYDVILKLIAVTYGTSFLRYIGCDEEIEKKCNIEITTLKVELPRRADDWDSQT